MLILLSPAKNLNFDPSPEGLEMTKPTLFSQTKILAEETRKLSRGDIQGLMGISDKLADLNYERFQSFKKTALPAGAKQAALAFNGEVYSGLDAASLSEDDFSFAQEHYQTAHQ